MRYLITLRLDPHDATLVHARALVEPYGLKVDTDYGLVSISPKRGLYVVRVDGDPGDADSVALSEEVVGVHGDVKVAPIDPDDTGSKGE
ncbi:MAG: hypothetical protein WAK53_09720 [Chromatiaceae bacterium]|jgi:hypothetical protein